MALINNIIPDSNFEVVLKKIASILLIEVTNQISLQSLNDNVEVYTERMIPFDKSEDVIINVFCSAQNFQNITKRDSTGLTDYYVDVYTRGFESDSETGEDKTRLKLHKYISICRYILSSSAYKTLDTGNGIVGGVYVNSIQYDLNFENKDAAFVRMARLNLAVKLSESQLMDNPIDFLGNDTVTKLSVTDKGHKIIFNT